MIDGNLRQAEAEQIAWQQIEEMRGTKQTLGRSISSGKGASIKQARHACRLHKDAIEKGFQPDKDGK